MRSIIKKRFCLCLLVAAVTICTVFTHNSSCSASDRETLFLLISDGAPGSNVFQDISANRIQVTPAGNTNHSTALPKFGDTSIKFDGSGDYLTLAQDPLYNIGYENFTVDMWVYLNAPNAILVGGGAFMNGGMLIYQASGQLYAGITGVCPNGITTSALPTGAWTHVALLRDGGQVKLYVNGVSVGSDLAVGPYTAAATSPYQIGAFPNYTILYPYNGFIDVVRYTNAAVWTNNFVPPTSALSDIPVKWEVTGNNDLVTEGKVGIGTATPQSALAVNGTITAKEVVVTDAGWADYVFDQSYILPELTSVEIFINHNHHLPGIPRSSVIAKSGISVSEMFGLQMQKIEELTLYMIALEKQNREMVEKIRLLEAEHSQRLNHE